MKTPDKEEVYVWFEKWLKEPLTHKEKVIINETLFFVKYYKGSEINEKPAVEFDKTVDTTKL